VVVVVLLAVVGPVRGIVCWQVLRKIVQPLKFQFTLDNFGCHFI